MRTEHGQRDRGATHLILTRRFTADDFMTMLQEHQFVENLDAAIVFHRNNGDGPYDVDRAVIAALLEVRNAFAKATGQATHQEVTMRKLES